MSVAAAAPAGASRAARGWALRAWCAAGAADAATGALLVAAPGRVLALLGTPGTGATALAAGGTAVLLPWRWVGVFVLAVGVLYLYPFAAGVARGARLGTLAEATAIVRALVAAFVVAALAAGELPAGWSLVAATDGGLAAAQLLALRRGWLDGD